MISIWLGSLEAYNDGELVGTWITLPLDDEELRDYYNLYTSNGAHDYFIADHESDFGLNIGEYEDPFKINEMARKMEGMKDWELDQFKAAYSLREPGSIDEVMELLDNLDDFILYPDVKDDDDLGMNYMDEIVTAKDNWLLAYVDSGRLGRDIRLENGGIHTEWGYVCEV